MNGTETDAQIKMQVIQETDQTDKAESPAADQSRGAMKEAGKWATKLVLRRPVGTVLAILCLIIVRLILSDKKSTAGADTGYEHVHDDCNDRLSSGASPDDVSELVRKPIEDRASTLSGLDTISSQSKENMSIVMLEI